MSGQAGTLEQLALELAAILGQVGSRMKSGRVRETLGLLGVYFPEQLLADAGFVAATDATATAAQAVQPEVAALLAEIEADDTVSIVARVAAVLTRTGQTIASFANVANQLQAVGPTLPGVTAQQVNDLVADFPKKLLDLFIASALDLIPAVGGTLTLLGIVEKVEIPGDSGNPTKPRFEKTELHLNRILDFANRPGDYLTSRFAWGDPGFDGTVLLQGLGRLLERLSFPTTYFPPSGGQPARLDAFAFDLTADSSTAPPGLRIDVLLPIGGNVDVPLPGPTPAWLFHAKFDGKLTLGTSATLRPPFTLEITPSSTSGQIDGVAQLVIEGRPAAPFILLGQAGGSRLEVGRVDGQVGVRFNWSSVTGKATVEPVVGASVTGGRLLVDASQGDGFLTTILAGIKIDAPFDLGFTWSLSGGIQFQGSGMLEIQIPLNLSLGPLHFIRAYIGAGFKDGTVPIELSAAISAQIGPVAAAVDRLGVRATLSFPPGGGNVGPVQLDFMFKPPTGVGLAIDAGPISGGGFISYDEPNGRYAGVLALEIFSVKVSAIGLIDTKLPDGRTGYSFLIIISVEFFPIQLGFGFTLIGVGGICGIHRTINAEALRLGVYAGSLDSIMFPRDPVRNAPQIISDLSRIFPPEEGQFVFGPMAKIGWGTPTLVEISLGIIIELPDPIRIALLGQIAAFFPERRAAIVEIHIDFVAMIDFGAKLLSLDATLRDSRIVLFTLTGDMAFRLCWGDQPNFAIALGGFHPHFQPPPGFPALRRLTLGLGAGDWIRISCSTYQALTSNSLQFGARAELYISVGVFVRGWIGFDALIIFSPFSFEVTFTAGLEIGVGDLQLAGVSVEGTLSGPTPWRVRGEATISLFFFDLSVDVDVKFGSEEKAVLAPADPWPPLRDALKEPRNWAALPAAGSLPIVTLSLPPGVTATVIDPAGKMTWKETVAPLDRTLSRFGNSGTPAPVKFTVDRVTVGTSPAAFTTVRDFFASAQFEELTDAEKLSRPSFEPMQAGVEVASAAVKAGPSISAPLTYETDYDDPEHGPSLRALFVVPLWMQQGLLLNSGGRQSGLVQAGTRAFAAPTKLAQAEEQFVIVSTDDLAVKAEISAPTTKGAAHQALKAYVATRPAERDALQVVPVHELEDV
ncbi:MAG TPA: DUF6603 domain-containing protein [Gemmatimonadales bacterium]